MGSCICYIFLCLCYISHNLKYSIYFRDKSLSQQIGNFCYCVYVRLSLKPVPLFSPLLVLLHIYIYIHKRDKNRLRFNLIDSFDNYLTYTTVRLHFLYAEVVLSNFFYGIQYCLVLVIASNKAISNSNIFYFKILSFQIPQNPGLSDV